MSMGGVNSAGTQVNRMLDAIGMPDAYGDKIGAMIDLSRGDMGGFHRNIVDLASGMSTKTMDRLMSGHGNICMSRGFTPRCHFSGPHLHRHSATYAMHERVGGRARVGQKFDTGARFFGLKIKGRVSGRMYRGSFRRPVRCGKSGYLYRGRMYKNMGAIMKDMRDGRVDGLATRRFRVGGWCRTPMMTRLPQMIGGMFNPATNIAQTLGKLFGAGGGLLGGIPQGGMGGGGGAGGAQGAQGAQGAGGASPSSESVLSNPNLSLEDKLMMLMSKLSAHMDKQIEDKMKQLESAMGQKKGGAAGKKGGGGLFGALGGLGKMAGGAFGAAFGGPLGGMVGSAAGGMLGNMLGSAASKGGAGGAAGKGGADGKKPNMQKLQSELQSLMQKRQQMFQTMTNIMKSLHDTSMSAIRNLKA